MCAIDGKPAGDGLHTFVNQDGEIRQMQLVQAKSNISIKPMILGMVIGLEEHGHPKTELVYSDSAHCEFQFSGWRCSADYVAESALLEACMPHLLKDVKKVRPISKYDDKPEYTLSIPTIYADTFDEVEQGFSEIMSMAISLEETEQVYVGFDMEWEVAKDAQGRPRARVGDNRVDLLQVSNGKKVYVFRVSCSPCSQLKLC